MGISITKRREFIHHIFDFFRVEETENLVNSYDMALTTKFPVDWNAFYQEIVKTSEKRVLPMPKYFSEKVSMFRKMLNVESQVPNGSIVRVTLKDGKYYDFTVDNLSDGTTLNDVKKRYAYKDATGRIDTKIKKIVCYPKDTTLMNEGVYFNVNVRKTANMTIEEYERKIAEKEDELKKQVKILFLAPSES